MRKCDKLYFVSINLLFFQSETFILHCSYYAHSVGGVGFGVRSLSTSFLFLLPNIKFSMITIGDSNANDATIDRRIVNT